MSSSDRFFLQRFIDAQDPVMQRVLGELRAGAKRTHWMWFVFPQIAGPGVSPMAQRYSLRSLDEAKAYLEHQVLGARLLECVALVLKVEGRSATQIFGWPDDLKLHSSMTLFARAAAIPVLFTAALDKYFDGAADEATLARLR